MADFCLLLAHSSDLHPLPNSAGRWYIAMDHMLLAQFTYCANYNWSPAPSLTRTQHTFESPYFSSTTLLRQIFYHPVPFHTFSGRKLVIVIPNDTSFPNPYSQKRPMLAIGCWNVYFMTFTPIAPYVLAGIPWCPCSQPLVSSLQTTSRTV